MPVTGKKSKRLYHGLAGREEPEPGPPAPSVPAAGPRLAGREIEPLPPQEKKEEKSGRPPIHGRAMTAAERKRRQRELAPRMAPIKRIIAEIKKLIREQKIDDRTLAVIVEMVREQKSEDSIIKLLKLIGEQYKDDRRKHKGQGFFMKDAPNRTGGLVTGGYNGAKLALIDAYQNPGWDGEESTFAIPTKVKDPHA